MGVDVVRGLFGFLFFVFGVLVLIFFIVDSLFFVWGILLLIVLV